MPRRSVDLPAPFGPITATSEPEATSPLRWCTAGCRSYPRVTLWKPSCAMRHLIASRTTAQSTAQTATASSEPRPPWSCAGSTRAPPGRMRRAGVADMGMRVVVPRTMRDARGRGHENDRGNGRDGDYGTRREPFKNVGIITSPPVHAASGQPVQVPTSSGGRECHRPKFYQSGRAFRLPRPNSAQALSNRDSTYSQFTRFSTNAFR